MPAPAALDQSKSLVSAPRDAGNPIGSKAALVEGAGEPPAVGTPKPLLKPVSGGVLNGAALNLPSPVYPDVARRMRAEGQVTVEVVIDETGRVVSARAVNGKHHAARSGDTAAQRARFSPPKLSVNRLVAGVITTQLQTFQ